MISDRMANIVIGVVTTMWVLNLLVGTFGSWIGLDDYKSSDAINGIFTAIMTASFALRAKGKSKNEEDEDG